MTSDGRHNEGRHDFLQPSRVKTHCDCADGFVGASCELRDYKLVDKINSSKASLHPGTIAGVSIGSIVLALAVVGFVRTSRKRSHNAGIGTLPATCGEDSISNSSERFGAAGLRQRRQGIEMNGTEVDPTAPKDPEFA
jgi:hypothetical protein